MGVVVSIGKSLPPSGGHWYLNKKRRKQHTHTHTPLHYSVCVSGAVWTCTALWSSAVWATSVGTTRVLWWSLWLCCNLTVVFVCGTAAYVPSHNKITEEEWKITEYLTWVLEPHLALWLMRLSYITLVWKNTASSHRIYLKHLNPDSKLAWSFIIFCAVAPVM